MSKTAVQAALAGMSRHCLVGRVPQGSVPPTAADARLIRVDLFQVNADLAGSAFRCFHGTA